MNIGHLCKSMRRAIPGILLGVGMLFSVAVQAAAPVVSGVAGHQRAGTKLVDIIYTVNDADGDQMSIAVSVSYINGSGTVVSVPMNTLSGDGANGVKIDSGTHALVWDAGADWPGQFTDKFAVTVTVDDGKPGAGGYMVIDLSGGPDAASYPVSYLNSLPNKQTGNANYNAATAVSKALVIGKRDQTIAFNDFAGHFMGDANFPPDATVPSGLPIIYTSATPAVATIVGGKIHIVGKGSSVITAKQAGNANWNAALPVSQKLDVAMGNQIITFNDIPNKVYGNADFAPGAATSSSSGILVIYTSSNLSVATIVSGKIHIMGVGESTITASQAGNINWNSATPVTQKLTVGKGTPAITWTNPAAITYGTLLSATQLNARANVPGKLTYTPVLGRKLIAGPQTLTVDFVPTDSSRYNNIHKEVTLTVKAATATLTIAGLSQKYDGTARPVTVKTVPAGLKVDITYNGNADAPTDVGSYTVQATVNDSNGTGMRTGTLIISKGVQTINFPALLAMRIGDEDCSLTATSSPGLPVSYASSNSAVATIVGGSVHLTGTGSTTITASQTGNTNWNAAPVVRQTLKVLIDGEVSAFYANMKRLIENHDRNRFFALFAPDYFHHGINRSDMMNYYMSLDTNSIKTINFNITRITVNGSGAKVYASASMSFNNGNPTGTWSEPDTTGFSPGLGWLRKTGGTWQVIGDQVGAQMASIASAPIQENIFAAVAPTVTLQPSSLSVAAGKNSTFTVMASGMPVPTYSWQYSEDGGVMWNNLENTATYGDVTTNTLTVSNAMAAMSRYQFRCIASNRVGSASSDGAILRVAPATLELSGSDDFATTLCWSAPTLPPGKNGILTFADNTLGYTLAASSGDDLAIREWTPNVGSYTHDWEVQVDVHLDSLNLTDGQYANLNLVVINANDAIYPIEKTDHMSAAIDRCASGGGTVCDFSGNAVGYYLGTVHDAGTAVAPSGSTDAALKITFNSATKELSSWYDADGAIGGYNWTLLQKVNIGGGTYAWDMNDNSAFAVMLIGGSGGVTLTSGQAGFNNFQASTSWLTP